ncbi:MAG: hypothetical protein ACI88C_000043 [Acidimicrobiales bacterium]|jgi:hypothetical protein
MGKGLMFYEGMPLGNEQPMSFFPQLVRQVRGHNAPSDTLMAGPKVGAYGYGYIYSVKGQHVIADGDFVTWVDEVQTIELYCAATTREVENRSVAEHNVQERRLGRLGWVDDMAIYGLVNTVSDVTTTLGGVRLAFGATNTIAAGILDVGDFIVVTEASPDVTLPTVGEVAVITDIDTGSDPIAWVEFAQRRPPSFGGTSYPAYSLWVMPCAFSVSGLAFRNAAWTAPRTLAEGADAPAGISFLFEGAEKLRRIGDTVVQELAYGGGGDYEAGTATILNALVPGDDSLDGVPPAPALVPL